MKRGGLLNKHIISSEKNLQISPMRQQKLSIFTFPIIGLCELKVAIVTRVFIGPEPKTQLFVPPTFHQKDATITY